MLLCVIETRKWKSKSCSEELNSLLEITSILTGVDHSEEPSDNLIDICASELENLFDSLAGKNLVETLRDMEDTGFKPIGPVFEDNFRSKS